MKIVYCPSNTATFLFFRLKLRVSAVRAIIGPSMQHFKVKQNAIELYALFWIPQFYNKCYNIHLYKIVKTGCKLATNLLKIYIDK